MRGLVRQLCENEGVNVPVDQAPSVKSLEDGIPLWEAWMVSQYRPSSIRQYVYTVKRLLSDDPSPTTLSLQQHQAARLRSGISPTAVKNDLKAFKSFFGYLYDNGLWFENPARRLKAPRVPKRRVKSPSPEEVTKLLGVIDRPKLAIMLALFLDTGIRFGELAGLEWERVNLEDREITVIGKGDKERTISISPLICAILEKVKGSNNHNGLVFPSQSIRGWDNRDANRSLERLCRKAGIKKYTCHQFRHFFATYTIEHGGEGVIAAVSEMLGHAYISTTVDFYVDTNKERNKKVHAEHAPFTQLMLPEVRSESEIVPAVRGAELLKTVIERLEALKSHQPSPRAVTMTIPVQVHALPEQN